jgi:hypothetical protein
VVDINVAAGNLVTPPVQAELVAGSDV